MEDTTNSSTTFQQLQRQLDMQKLLIDMASKYINIPLDGVNDAINRSLKEMGRFVKADRAYIFEYHFRTNTAQNTYEWCADGIDAQIDYLQELPLDNISQWVDAHSKNQPFGVPDVSALPHDGPGGLRDILEPQGIKSLITIPMTKGDNFIGSVGFDAVQQHYVFSETEITILRLFADMLVNIHLRKTAEEDRTRALSMIQRQNEKLKNYAFVVSHQIRSHSSNIEGLLNLVRLDHPAFVVDPAFAMLMDVSKAMDQTLREITDEITRADLEN